VSFVSDGLGAATTLDASANLISPQWALSTNVEPEGEIALSLGCGEAGGETFQREARNLLPGYPRCDEDPTLQTRRVTICTSPGDPGAPCDDFGAFLVRPLPVVDAGTSVTVSLPPASVTVVELTEAP
ncbi:MAG: hypothetical protein K8I02_00250, partial [Candidatus Methylomirabilis sp.]|nr:hypothetical protein [Deltaproteobacteria bacterium]